MSYIHWKLFLRVIIVHLIISGVRQLCHIDIDAKVLSKTKQNESSSIYIQKIALLSKTRNAEWVNTEWI